MMPAGWYPDPDNGSQQRYWDGRQWTDNYAPYATAQPDMRPAWEKQQVTPEARRGNLVALVIFAVIVIVGVVVAVRVNNDRQTSEPQVTRPSVTQVVPYDPADYCDPAQPKALKQLERGATPYNQAQGVRLTNGWSTKSLDYRQVYFVAAVLPSGKVAVFKVNSDPSNLPTGASLKAQAESVNGAASNNFIYPYAPLSGGATMKDDGAQEAYDCADAG